MVDYGQMNTDNRIQINQIGLTKCEHEIALEVEVEVELS